MQDLLTEKEAAAILGVSHTKMREWRHRRNATNAVGPAWVWSKGKVRYRRADVNDYLSRRQRGMAE